MYRQKARGNDYFADSLQAFAKAGSQAANPVRHIQYY
jgi:hypothetical protein